MKRGRYKIPGSRSLGYFHYRFRIDELVEADKDGSVQLVSKIEK